MEGGKNCSTCMYSHKLEKGRECRYGPPAVLVVESDNTVSIEEHFPGVYEGDWCGEYRRDILRGITDTVVKTCKECGEVTTQVRHFCPQPHKVQIDKDRPT